jgi:hypothetical protein
VNPSGHGVLIRPCFHHGRHSSQCRLQLAMAELCQP